MSFSGEHSLLDNPTAGAASSQPATAETLFERGRIEKHNGNLHAACLSYCQGFEEAFFGCDNFTTAKREFFSMVLKLFEPKGGIETNDRTEILQKYTALPRIETVRSGLNEQLEFYLKVLPILQSDPHIVASLLADIGVGYRCTSDSERSVVAHFASLAIIDIQPEISISDKHKGIKARNVRALSETLILSGEYKRAIQLLEKILEYCKAERLAQETADVLLTMGVCLRALSLFSRSISCLTQAIDTARGMIALNPENTTAVTTLKSLITNLSGTFIQIGLYDKALEQLNEAFTLNEKLGLPQTVVFGHIGHCYYSKREYIRALEYYQKGLDMDPREQNVMLKKTHMALIKLDMAERPENQSNAPRLVAEAKAMLEESLALSRKLNSKHREAAIALNLAQVEGEQSGDVSAFSQSYERALKMCLETDQVSEIAHGYHTYGRALLKNDHLEVAKQMLLEAEKYHQKCQEEAAEDELMVAYRNQEDVTEFYSDLIKAYVCLKQVLAALDACERGRAQALIREMAFKRNIQVSPLNHDHMHAFARRSGQTLVIYSIDKSERKITDQGCANVWVIPAGDNQKPSFHALHFSRALLHKATSYISSSQPFTRQLPLDEISRNEGKKSVLSHKRKNFLNDSEAEQLYESLWMPLEQDLPTNSDDIITICSDGQLALLPFAALIDKNKRRLAMNHTIMMTPSITAHKLIFDALKPEVPRKFLLVGNPKMPRATMLPELPAAEAEIHVAAAKLHGFGSVCELIGEKAIKSVIVDQLQSSTIVHIATHGLIEPGPNRPDIIGALVLGVTDTDTYNEKFWKLYAEEIQRLKLNQCDLVILSCCNTARGAVSEEGLLGFGRAFLFAGAKAVLLNLWTIMDTRPGREDNPPVLAFFDHFYSAYLNEQKSAAASLRSAMMAMNQIVSAKDWSTWVLFGNGS